MSPVSVLMVRRCAGVSLKSQQTVSAGCRVWPVGNKDCQSDQGWDLSLGIPRDVYHPPSLPGQSLVSACNIRAGK